jgi:hypothetical protein
MHFVPHILLSLVACVLNLLAVIKVEDGNGDIDQIELSWVDGFLDTWSEVNGTYEFEFWTASEWVVTSYVGYEWNAEVNHAMGMYYVGGSAADGGNAFYDTGFHENELEISPNDTILILRPSFQSSPNITFAQYDFTYTCWADNQNPWGYGECTYTTGRSTIYGL